MERGYLLPSGDYIQAIDADENTINLYPAGTIEVPLKTNAYDIWDDVAGAWIEGPEPEPTKADVDAEKDRRKFGGFTFQGVEYQSDLVSLVNISGAGSLAGFAIGQGAAEGDFIWYGAEPFGWIATDNTITPMDAQTMLDFSKAAAAHVSKVTFAAKTIKALDPIPADFKADQYWGAE